jgi:transposase
MRYELTDHEWFAIKRLLPNKPRGVPRVDDRRVLNGIFCVLRSGAPWRDLPRSLGPYTTSYNRFVRWRRAGVWSRIMSALATTHDASVQVIDTSTQLVTDRVRAGWSCHLVTILFSQLPGPRSAVTGRMKDEVHRLYSTLLTRVHRKPRTASTNELPVLIAVMDLPVHKHNKSSGPMVLYGLHVHALMLIPPTSRLKCSRPTTSGKSASCMRVREGPSSASMSGRSSVIITVWSTTSSRPS